MGFNLPCIYRTKSSVLSAIISIYDFLISDTPKSSPRIGRYPNFDLMRLLLALEVAFVHAWAAVDEKFSWPGYVMAVPAFLSISGFLVLQSYSESKSWTEFIKKRGLRLLPALIVSFILVFLLFDYSATYNSIVNWLTGGLITPPGIRNVPLWSLAWEEAAYLMLAILWLIGAYKKPACIWALFIFSTALVWAASDLDPHTRMIFFLGPAFFTGNLMYIYRDRLLNVNPIVPWIVFYVMIQWQYVPDSKLFGGAYLAVFQAFAVVWVGMAGAQIIKFKIPDISYGVYIYHMPIIQYFLFIKGTTDFTQMIMLVSACLVPFSLASWFLIEKPALKLKNKKQAISETNEPAW
jgi:peptidoglycan/LPS O-acetylase OafA/YrhL